MRKIDQAIDVNGRELLRGDTVTAVASGGMTGKVRDIVYDEGALFVEVRPAFQYAGKGVWHAADRLLWLSRPRPKPAKPKPAAATSASGPRNASVKPVKLRE